MSLFCPTCHNLLQLSDGSGSSSGGMRFKCESCSYNFAIREKVILKKFLSPKPPDDAISAQEEMKQCAKTQAVCPECNHNEAYFFQMQIRSGDEASTTFFCCTQCQSRWKEE
eukprot:Blabericola_migrator_1__1021@NODE_1257_length_4964_cov_22_802736_g850_i0_p4_GENE_NODE_1257_length_4964_cov_22_802736_g850_i0NODE_1257_length_4964_cov_22_802736_g850_i0_p4_ORF_typecomplete_len112_score4_92TFIIS_C/PF01096_18/1e03TFIIS_C/PF01096_18/9_1e17RNA_POL_M_15KD/PF02150_16/4_8e08RNA_POL_M_15KD/PF02150_16/62RNA_POL_M_15KD/PF02150_16/37Zn_Tnp_IS1595/PF12760_7/0_18Zn_Tnp_IS1595/PF12760_7/0_042PhnA_Zn_Ribbon/PF08274_12/31PhnA_Zn_Ribbon/PF08274_12/2_1e02PhnA_Zn_Ribbon/PF08274_12/0_99PhnA_Zn_Ribbo